MRGCGAKGPQENDTENDTDMATGQHPQEQQIAGDLAKIGMIVGPQKLQRESIQRQSTQQESIRLS